MERDKKPVRTSRGNKQYTCLGCPLTRNRTAWCFRLCTPDEEGNGRCGRIAPHSLRSRTQLSIEHYNEKVILAHCEKLEHLYLAAPCNEYFDPGIRVSEGQAEIVIPIQEKFFHTAGSVHASVCFTAMADSALFAVNSIVEKALVLTVSFNTDLTRPISAGELIAKGRFLGRSDDRYLAESVLTDPEGREIGRGSGAFAESTIPLSPEIGYR
jgi:uncharacterized protein (TIGR00369 family)